MVQVLAAPPPKRKKFLESVLGSFTEGIPKAVGLYQQYEQKKQENEALKKLGLEDLSGLSPELKKAALVEQLKSQGKLQNFEKKAELLGLTDKSKGKNFQDEILSNKPKTKISEEDEDQYEGPSDEEIAKHA